MGNAKRRHPCLNRRQHTQHHMRIDMPHMTKAKKTIARRITRRGHPQTDCQQDGAFAQRVLMALLEQGLFVRMPFVAPQNRCIRISTGTAENMQLLAKAMPMALQQARQG